MQWSPALILCNVTSVCRSQRCVGTSSASIALRSSLWCSWVPKFQAGPHPSLCQGPGWSGLPTVCSGSWYFLPDIGHVVFLKPRLSSVGSLELLSSFSWVEVNSVQLSTKVPASVPGMAKSGDGGSPWPKLDFERLILTLDTWISSPMPGTHLATTPP